MVAELSKLCKVTNYEMLAVIVNPYLSLGFDIKVSKPLLIINSVLLPLLSSLGYIVHIQDIALL